MIFWGFKAIQDIKWVFLEELFVKDELFHFHRSKNKFVALIFCYIFLELPYLRCVSVLFCVFRVRMVEDTPP